MRAVRGASGKQPEAHSPSFSLTRDTPPLAILNTSLCKYVRRSLAAAQDAQTHKICTQLTTLCTPAIRCVLRSSAASGVQKVLQRFQVRVMHVTAAHSMHQPLSKINTQPCNVCQPMQRVPRVHAAAMRQIASLHDGHNESCKHSGGTTCAAGKPRRARPVSSRVLLTLCPCTKLITIRCHHQLVRGNRKCYQRCKNRL